MNNIHKMPDAYKKTIGSNLYDLLQLANLLDVDQKADFNSIEGSHDIEFAYGKTLDRYGEMVGIQRSGATDEQYRVNILGAAGKRVSGGDCNSTIHVIADMLSVGIDSFRIYDMSDSIPNANAFVPAAIRIVGLSSEVIAETGFTSAQIKQMINDILPAGVRLETLTFDGTLDIMRVSNVNPSDTSYPTLSRAWEAGQNAPETVLAGYGENPNDSSDSGTFDGGTLGYGNGEI